MLTDLRLDHAGLAEILKSGEVAAAVHELAEEIAANVATPEEAEVVVDDYATDRAASSVTIRHPLAALWQADDGVLTRAAGNSGLEVTERA